jgi:hypothetical protein
MFECIHELRIEIYIFLEMKGLEMPEFISDYWVHNLAFLVALTANLNETYMKL